jgi:hypothetical protein
MRLDPRWPLLPPLARRRAPAASSSPWQGPDLAATTRTEGSAPQAPVPAEGEGEQVPWCAVAAVGAAMVVRHRR